MIITEKKYKPVKPKREYPRLQIAPNGNLYIMDSTITGFRLRAGDGLEDKVELKYCTGLTQVFEDFTGTLEVSNG
jgi:hypothetical protein